MHERAGVMHVQYYKARSSLTCTILSLSAFKKKNIFKSEKKLNSGPLLLTTLGFFLDKLMRIFNCQMHVLVNLCIYYVKRLFNCLPISTTYSCLVFHSTCICKHISSLLFFGGGGCINIILHDTFNLSSFYFIFYLAFRII